MVCAESMLKVADNSGARFAKCIRVLGKKFAGVGDKVIVSIRAVSGSIERTKVGKGEVHEGIIVRTRKGLIRSCGSWARFDDNAIVLINKKGVPLGTRVLGPIGREVREKGYQQIVSLSRITI
jgi:large subunit ribosomal protein L14